ncbi:claudin domain-containing protein 1a isoform X2 [Trichomycterus rosablanca]|uniref:claudin domain-containing protein 1a isoform X2 n=1 Tax=Trichomycterus rosablanca TaxID=2290929 RepID=UPI002F3599BF
MVENRSVTALVIAAVLSLLASVYLSAAVCTRYWYLYTSPEFDEKSTSDGLFLLNGTVGLWGVCVSVPADTTTQWYKEPDPQMVMECVSFTLSHQFTPKYKEPGNHNSGEDMIRTYLWRSQFLLPLLSLALVFLGGLVGFCACMCRSFSPTLGIGLLHLLAGVCSLACVCCFMAGMDLLHRVSVIPDQVDGSLGWSLYLALISSPLYMMAAALLMWAARNQGKSYEHIAAYRVA